MADTRTCLLTTYTSAGCNRTPFSADWGKNRLIAYGFSHAIALYEYEHGSLMKGGSIVQTLTGHSDRVNCVKWIKNGKEETELVSGSTDNTAIVWQIADDQTYKQLCTLKGHTGSVTCIAAIQLSEDKNQQTFIATASIDSTVRIWFGPLNDIKEQQVLSFGSGFVLALAFIVIPDTHVPLLACGGDDHKIHLYVMADEKMFTPVLTLPGHEDWIRDLDFAVDDSKDILLASCAQDHLIRVWKLAHKPEGKDDTSQVQSIADLPMDKDITVRETTFEYQNELSTTSYAVSLESVLCGHENKVYSIKWKPEQHPDKDTSHQPMCLLSASMDKTMILWVPDVDSGVWIEKVRVGDVGGNTLGLYGGIFSPCGKSILGHGYQGAFHQWTYDEVADTWGPQVTGGGHFDSVEDVGWSTSGNFIISVSKDQTSRLHAPWVIKDNNVDDIELNWFEVARPQVHGYDLQCMAILGPYSFASGADEKITRIFSAPRSFISNFCQICDHDIDKELARVSAHLPEGANVPALGLSNKAVFTAEESPPTDENWKSGTYPEIYFTPTSLSAPPSEDQLLQNTLWAEEGKLYGHGYEIFSLAAHPNGKLLASACKAAKVDSANILLWDMDTKRSIASLTGLSLTITDMAFSHNGHFLLAVSRDRTWALFQQQDDGSFAWKTGVDKRTAVHSRIIWACAWAHDDNYFFTASRDKKVLVWPSQANSATLEPVSGLTHSESVTAISLAPVLVKEKKYLVATGLENGQIHLHTWNPSKTGKNEPTDWVLVASLDQREAHHLTVTRLAFRTCTGLVSSKRSEDTHWLQLASCGSDHAVRVYSIDVNKL